MERLLNFIIKTSIYLTVFLVPLAWSPWTLEVFEFPKQYILIFLVLLGLLAWLAKMVLVERELHFKRTPLDVPIFLFAAVAILSSLFSADLWSSLFGHYGRFSDGLFGILGAIGLYVLVINTVKQPASLARVFLLSASVALTVGYLSLFGVLKLQLIGFNTVAGSLEGFCIFIAFVISFLAILALRPKVKQLPFVGNILLLFFAFGFLLIVDIFQAWLVLSIGLLVVLLFGLFQRVWTGEVIKLRRLWLPFILLLLTVIFVFSPTRVPGSPTDASQELTLTQEISWNIAFKTLQESGKNLVLGSGPGTFALDFSLHRSADFNQTSQWQMRFDRSGNYFAEVLATMGILGFLSYLGLVLWFLLISLIFLKDKKSIPFVVGSMVLLVAQLMYPQITVLQVVFWLFLAFAAISWGASQREFRFSLKRFLEFDIIAKAILLIVFFGVAGAFFFGARFFVADMNYFISQNTLNQSPQVRIDRVLEAVRLNPWQAEYKIFLSRLYLNRALGELRKPENSRNEEQISNDVQYAIAYTRGDTLENKEITGATQLAKNRVAVWETLGVVYRDITFAAGALEWGIRSFKTAITLEPTNPVLYNELGKLEVTKEKFKTARENFKKAVELKPDYMEAQLQLALLEEKEGELAKALVQMREMSLRYPLYVDGNFQLGRLLYNAGRVTEAIVQFERVLEFAPNHSNALFALGTAFENQGRIEEAIGKFEKVLQLNPNNPVLKERLQELGG